MCMPIIIKAYNTTTLLANTMCKQGTAMLVLALGRDSEPPMNTTTSQYGSTCSSPCMSGMHPTQIQVPGNVELQVTILTKRSIGLTRPHPLSARAAG